MNTLTVSIGRNKKGRPMAAADWTDFKRDIRVLFETIYTEAEGFGKWPPEKWEENCTFFGTTDYAKSNVNWFLGLMADKYGQDAIGYSLMEGTDSLALSHGLDDELGSK